MKESNSAIRKFMRAGLGSLAIPLDPGAAGAQHPAKVMPRAYRIAFQNDRLRVLIVNPKTPAKV